MSSDSDSDNGNEYEMDYNPLNRQFSNNGNGSNVSENIPINVLTENDVIGYIQERIRLAETNEIPWSPLMRVIFKQHEGQSEYLLGLIELMLDLPIQVNIIHETFKIDLNDEDVIIPFNGRLFIDAKKFINNLLNDDTITFTDIRERARYVFQRPSTPLNP